MIRIRFDGYAGLDFTAGHGIAVINDPRVIEIESAKGGPARVAAVDLQLRPIFERARELSAPPFYVVSVETRAGCNYGCSFCPVAHSVDPRRPGEMGWELLAKIATELADMNYTGRIGFFGNNEPLMDPRLPQVIGLFHRLHPEAELRVLTNGTYAREEVVRALFESGLSTLVINNYTDGRRLSGPVRSLLRAAERLLDYDIRVSVRSKTSVLTTRAGTAPNKPLPATPPRGFCALPFTDLFISYRGKVNLCCFDAYGTVEIGDVATQSIAEIWQSPEFDRYRQSLLQSRRNGLTLCQNCDYDGFRDPNFNRDRPLTRSDIAGRGNLDQESHVKSAEAVT